MVSEHLQCEDKWLSLVTLCLSPCLADSEREREEQRKRMVGVSHDSLFQLVIALKQGDGSHDVS